METIYKGKKFSLLDIEDHVVIITNHDVMITAIEGLHSVCLKKKDLFNIKKYQRNDYSCCPILKIGKRLKVEFHNDWTVIKQNNNQVTVKPLYLDKILEHLKNMKEKEKNNEK